MANLKVVGKTSLKYLDVDDDYIPNKEDLKMAAGQSISAIQAGLNLISNSPSDLDRNDINDYIGEIMTRLTELRYILIKIHEMNLTIMEDLD